MTFKTNTEILDDRSHNNILHAINVLSIVENVAGHFQFLSNVTLQDTPSLETYHKPGS